METSELELVIAGVLSGDRTWLAKAITLVESSTPDDRDKASELLASIAPHAGGSRRIGITGSPGVGKSTFVDELGTYLTELGHQVAVLAVDPSSSISGGSILGDKTRMDRLASNPNAFIRPSPSSGILGGVAKGTRETILVLEAAGFDVVLIETVGVGQDEVDIANACHTVVVLSAPGLGDDVQAIKAGVLETADIHVISKGDREDADKVVIDLKAMMGIGFVGRGFGNWTVPVIKTSTKTEEGVVDLMESIERHGAYLRESGELQIRQREIAEKRILKIVIDMLHKQINRVWNEGLSSVLEETVSRQLGPKAAADKLLRGWNIRS